MLNEISLSESTLNVLLAPKDFLLAPSDFLFAPRDFLSAPIDFLAAPTDFLSTPVDFLLAPIDLRGWFSFVALVRFGLGLFWTMLGVLMAEKLVLILDTDITLGTKGTPTCGDLKRAVRLAGGGRGYRKSKVQIIHQWYPKPSCALCYQGGVSKTLMSS